jgi:3-oxoacyl-[acyl-carrier-protein] synthase-1
MTPLAISGIGAFTAVGTSTPTTMAALLNNVQLFEAWSGLGPAGHKTTVAATPLARSLQGIARLAAMASHAVKEGAGAWPSTERFALVLCCPAEQDTGVEAKSLLQTILADGSLAILPPASVVIPRGREGLVEGLALARDVIARRRAAACVLVAVDSLLLRPRLLQLQRDGRLFDPTSNPNGFIPGEGAVALLFEAPRGRHQPLVAGVGVGREPGAPSPGRPGTGEGFSAAMQMAVAESQSKAAPSCAALDVTSPEVAQEIAFAKTRPPLAKAEALQSYYPSISVGEAGVMTSLLGLGMLAFFLSKSVVQGPGLALITGEERTRAAVAMTALPGGKGR